MGILTMIGWAIAIWVGIGVFGYIAMIAYATGFRKSLFGDITDIFGFVLVGAMLGPFYVTDDSSFYEFNYPDIWRRAGLSFGKLPAAWDEQERCNRERAAQEAESIRALRNRKVAYYTEDTSPDGRVTIRRPHYVDEQ